VVRGLRLAHLDPTVVLSPALGGIVIGQEVGRALQVRAIFAERQDGKLTLRRGFTLAPEDRVVVVEDVITTGLSTRETCDAAEAAGARVLGAGALVDRGADPARLHIPLQALVRMEVAAYQPGACPLCPPPALEALDLAGLEASIMVDSFADFARRAWREVEP
jgi:orotate phosphoribosyltransferase